MGTSRLTIFNMALGELPAARVDLVEESSLAGETCREHYPEALKLLLEDHDYDFAVRRAALAILTNDRSREWRFAYQLPGDCAKPLHILPYGAATTGAVYSWNGPLRAAETAVPFRVSDGKLYCNVENAVLEYVTDAPSEATFPALFSRAVSLELASRIVMPLLKDPRRRRDIIQLAEVARERAKAEDMNRDRESPFDFMPESYLARIGYGGFPWR